MSPSYFIIEIFFLFSVSVVLFRPSETDYSSFLLSFFDTAFSVCKIAAKHHAPKHQTPEVDEKHTSPPYLWGKIIWLQYPADNPALSWRQIFTNNTYLWRDFCLTSILPTTPRQLPHNIERKSLAVGGWSKSGNNTTSWLHLASWNLPDSQLSWESKMESECGNKKSMN